MEINLIVRNYLKIKEEIFKDLSLMNPTDLNKLSLETLTELLKDIYFESKAFELVLKLHPMLANEHIKKYYLSENPSNLSRFKGNIDIMLDDYKAILGKDAFDKLIKEMHKDVRNYSVIKDAIDFANDEQSRFIENQVKPLVEWL